jgi:hypothetical protein
MTLWCLSNTYLVDPKLNVFVLFVLVRGCVCLYTISLEQYQQRGCNKEGMKPHDVGNQEAQINCRHTQRRRHYTFQLVCVCVMRRWAHQNGAAPKCQNKWE